MPMTDVLNSNPFLNSHFNNGAQGMLVHLISAEIGFAAQLRCIAPFWRASTPWKSYPTKPLAVRLLEDKFLPKQAQKLLNTPASPIVVVVKNALDSLCEDVAPRLDDIGVLYNRLLRERLALYLSGFTLLFLRCLRAGSGISYGQAVIAAARLRRKRTDDADEAFTSTAARSATGLCADDGQSTGVVLGVAGVW